MQRTPLVELIYDTDCPNVAQARARLLAACAAEGINPRWREWERSAPDSPEYARRHGSPTVLVNSHDVEGTQAHPDAACCRIYRDSAGHRDGAPAVDTIRAALTAARNLSRAPEVADGIKRNTPALFAVGVAVLPKLTCAACWPAYAALLGSLGVSFVNYTPWLLPATALLLALTLASLGWRARQRRGYGPLLLGVAAAAAVVLGSFVLDSNSLLYGGASLLIVASVWNAWPSPRRAECPRCQPAQPPAQQKL